jgi:hypothetical protein
VSIRKLLLLVVALVVLVGASVRCYLNGEEAVRAATQPRALPEARPEPQDEDRGILQAVPARWEGPAARPQARMSEPARPPSSAAPGGASRAREASFRNSWSTCQKSKPSCAPPTAPAAPPAAAGAFAPDPGAM